MCGDYVPVTFCLTTNAAEPFGDARLTLTHWGLMMHICVSKLTIIVSYSVAWSAPSHYLHQCWNIVNWALRNKLQWDLNWNSYIFIQENTLKNVVRKMMAILSRPQCVKCGLSGFWWAYAYRQQPLWKACQFLPLLSNISAQKHDT